MMKSGMTVLFLGLALFAHSSIAGASVTHENKKLEIIHSGDERGCFFFKLEEVSVADASIAENPWFAVKLERKTAGDIFSMLVTAKASGLPVMVKTTGKAACGHAEVRSVRF